MKIVGYADRLSVRAGEPVTFHVSSEHAEYRPEIVRLRRGGSQRHGSALREEVVAAGLPERLPGQVRTTVAGSYVEARLPAPAGELGMALWFRPTLLGAEENFLIGVDDVAITVCATGVAVRSGAEVLARIEEPLVERQWLFVAATLAAGAAGDAAGAGGAGAGTAGGAGDAAGAAGGPGAAGAAGDAGATVRLVLHRPGRAEVVATGVQNAAGPPDEVPNLNERSAVFHNSRATPPRLARQSTATRGRVRVGAAAGGDVPGGFFNGKVARPVVATAAWPAATTTALAGGADPLDLLDPATTSVLDLAAEPGGRHVPDRGGLTTGAEIVNLPGRGVPGPFWTGAETDFRCAPTEFDALHLHDDDLADAGWPTDLTWAVPAELPTGVYALRTTAGDDVDRIPFVVTPAVHEAPVLVVLPTWTYLAYANWRTYAEYEPERLEIYGEARGVDPRDHWLAAHPALGRSLYDVHSDGSGVFHSSRLRPIVNLRPDYYTPTTRGFRHYAQDLLLLDWLDQRGEHYAVVTDDEVEREGVGLLSRYRVVLTGSHPEYCSAGMLDAYLDYTHTGGRLMYLGGNGFYQVTARHPSHPDAIEIRRGHAGVATWVSDPGEEHLAATGERGGLWRMRGRPPNVLAGVGFTAQGFDKGSGYVRNDGPSWVFDGVHAGPGEIFGAEGPGLGGAAGDELDRADITLGTPADAVVLASSTGHSTKIALVPEEADLSYAAPPPGIHPKVRADVVLVRRPGGGAVFSVGSIAWTTAMTHAGGTNDVARITANVLDRFRTGLPV